MRAIVLMLVLCSPALAFDWFGSSPRPQGQLVRVETYDYAGRLVKIEEYSETTPAVVATAPKSQVCPMCGAACSCRSCQCDAASWAYECSAVPSSVRARYSYQSVGGPAYPFTLTTPSPGVVLSGGSWAGGMQTVPMYIAAPDVGRLGGTSGCAGCPR